MYNGIRSPFVLFLIVFGAFNYVAASGSEPMVAWAKLNEDLLQELMQLPGQRSVQERLAWPQLKRLTTSRLLEKLEPSVWPEIVKQKDAGIAQLVAYHCISERTPQFSAVAALSIAITNPQVFLAAEVVGPQGYLKELKVTRENLDGFSLVLCQGFDASQRVNYAFAIGEVSEEFLENWIQERQSLPILPTNESHVVERLLASRRTFSPEIKMTLDRKLQVYSSLNGFPRLVFIRHATLDSASALKYVKIALSDEGIHDGEFSLAIIPHHALIREHFADFEEVGGEIAKRRLGRLREQVLRKK
jgi:hypothetical protein